MLEFLSNLTVVRTHDTFHTAIVHYKLTTHSFSNIWMSGLWLSYWLFFHHPVVVVMLCLSSVSCSGDRVSQVLAVGWTLASNLNRQDFLHDLVDCNASWWGACMQTSTKYFEIASFFKARLTNQISQWRYDMEKFIIFQHLNFVLI